MDKISYGTDAASKFVTNVGLITSAGPHGDNIMAAEWTNHVSYSPSLLSVHVGKGKATEGNIKASGEFGVSLAAADQNVVSSVAGRFTGKEVDKIAVLKALGFGFYKAKKIKVLMVEGAALNIECKVVKVVELGDHTMFVGEAIEATASEKEPLLYHGGKYFEVGKRIEKPTKDYLEKIDELAEGNPKN